MVRSSSSEFEAPVFFQKFLKMAGRVTKIYIFFAGASAFTTELFLVFGVVLPGFIGCYILKIVFFNSKLPEKLTHGLKM